MPLPDPAAFELAAYDYALPQERIAQYPLEERDASRLLVYEEGQVLHHRFRELPTLLPDDTLLVFNNTRVAPARVYMQRSTGAQVELLCLGPADEGVPVELAFKAQGALRCLCLAGNARRWKLGERLQAQDGAGRVFATAELEETRDGDKVVAFRWQPEDMPFSELLQHLGHMPLPPYMKRQAEAEDRSRYQTVYAQDTGSVAAPTAGLHFTEAVLAQLAARGIGSTELTLHVGMGTFKPVTEADARKHEMHFEEIVLTREAVARIARHQGPLVAVGTTSLRTLETCYALGCQVIEGKPLNLPFHLGQWEAWELPRHSRADAFQALLDRMDVREHSLLRGRTQLMIGPGYPVVAVDGIITNFHQPKSTLLLLIAALIGKDWQQVYQEALAQNYRFLSYGDSSLLWAKR